MRRRQRRAHLDGWEPIVERRVQHWALLDDAERNRLGELVEWLLRTKHFEAARGFALTQEIVISVASQAALLILGLDRDAYRDVRAIVIHPRTITRNGPRATTMRGVVADGPLRVLGHANDRRGPVVIAWDAVRNDARHPERGHNVVIHEFAHKIDVASGGFDGTPSFPSRSARAEWIDVCTREYRRLRRSQEPDAVLRGYAGTNPAEFFAVATEAFFDRALSLREEKPQLYGVLQRFYRQDPAARAEARAATPLERS
ncbi:MAG: zinc-dependent peptidase [Acidimicrobiales bacterium]